MPAFPVLTPGRHSRRLFSALARCEFPLRPARSLTPHSRSSTCIDGESATFACKKPKTAQSFSCFPRKIKTKGVKYMPQEIPTPSGQAGSDRSPVLPDPAICHTKLIGSLQSFADCLVESIGECLVEKPDSCPYLVYFGRGQFCTYLHWKDFLHLGKMKPNTTIENPRSELGR